MDQSDLAVENPKLPIGIQAFRKIRNQGYRYVDKTDFAAKLLQGGQSYFLSRPRRFGKSLFIDTLRELFEGSEELFRGLSIHGDWDWSVRYPVIHLSFGKGNFGKAGELEQRLSEMLGVVERAHNLSVNSTTLSGRFGDIISGLNGIFGQPTVILVDEYDKPILDATRNTEVMLNNRQTLQGFYSAIKDEDAHVRFCFVTGVSRFAQVSLFSATNNLEDITLSPEFSSICGYTEFDLDNVFSEVIAGLDREKIREWYNGYCWLGKEKVYNPYGMLLLFKQRSFMSRWYETGTPTCLIDVMEQRGVLPVMLDNITVSDDELIVSDFERISAASLMLQSGYMTIVGKSNVEGTTYYKLDYPNREVRQSFNVSMLNSLMPQDPLVLSGHRRSLVEVLVTGDTKMLEKALHAMFAGIPHQWHAGPGAANYESYFASVVYGYFFGSGIEARVEDSTSEGRIDLTAVVSTNIYLFEFKVVNDQPTGNALEQLKDKNYADKYQQRGKPIHLVAVEFSKKSRNIAFFKSELA